MTLRISGKQMNVGDALSQRIHARISDAVGKYFEGGYDGHVTLEKSGTGFGCDCLLHLDSGMTLQAAGREAEPAASFEAAAARIEKRLRRYKRKLKNRHGAGQTAGQLAGQSAEAGYTVMASPDGDADIPEDYNPAIIAEMSTQVANHSVAEAVMRLDLTDNPLIVFTNAANGRINVVYRRPDGNIGWIDPRTAN